MAQFNLNQTVVGLRTVTINIPSTDLYNFQGTLQLRSTMANPTPGPGAGAGTGTNASPTQDVPSQVLVTINKNGSPVYTGQAGAKGFSVGIQCAANDVITIVTSSSLASDAGLAATKLTLAVSEGPL